MNFQSLINKFSNTISLESGHSTHVRHNVYSTEGKQSLELYSKAVALMKQRSELNAGDPLGWNYQAGIHGTFMDSREGIADWALRNGYIDSW